MRAEQWALLLRVERAGEVRLGRARRAAERLAAAGLVELSGDVVRANRTGLQTYIDVADEVTGGLTLADLDEWTEVAEAAAARLGLSWPPTDWWEDEVRDAQASGRSFPNGV